MKQLILAVLIGACAGFLAQPCPAQLLDAVTGPGLGTVEPRLYLSRPAEPANLAPVDTELWFISDGGAAGIPTLGATKEMFDAIRAGIADDKLIDVPFSINGNAIIGSQEGVFLQTGMEYSPVHHNKSIFALLWSDSHGGDAGDRFGILEFSLSNGRLVPPTGIGNYELRIDQNIFTDDYTVFGVPVPEIPQQGIITGAICLAAAVVWKFRRRKLDAELKAMPANDDSGE